MYVAARMVLIPYATHSQYTNIISDVQQDVSIVSAISVVSISIWQLMFVSLKDYSPFELTLGEL